MLHRWYKKFPKIQSKWSKWSSNRSFLIHKERGFKIHVCHMIYRYLEEKLRNYRWLFNVKSPEKTQQVRENWSQQLEHKQIKKRGGNQVPGSVPCWHVTRCKCSEEPLAIRWRSSSVSMSWKMWKVWSVRKSLNWSRVRMSFNIRERKTSYCWIRFPYRP